MGLPPTRIDSREQSSGLQGQHQEVPLEDALQMCHWGAPQHSGTVTFSFSLWETRGYEKARQGNQGGEREDQGGERVEGGKTDFRSEQAWPKGR